jgi:hypothetical protein
MPSGESFIAAAQGRTLVHIKYFLQGLRVVGPITYAYLTSND